MSGVFKVSKDGKAVLNKDAAKLCKYLPLLDEKVFLYLVLSEDYTYGPLHLKPYVERQVHARKMVWGNKPPAMDKIDYLPEAIEEYRSLIFDALRYKRDSYTAKLLILGKQFEAEEDPLKLNRIMASMETVEEKLKLIDNEIDRKDERIELTGNRTISLIERFMRNRKEYNEFMNT